MYNVPYAYCAVISAKDYMYSRNDVWLYWKYALFWILSSTAIIVRLLYCDQGAWPIYGREPIDQSQIMDVNLVAKRAF
jgi:hypothetical protein